MTAATNPRRGPSPLSLIVRWPAKVLEELLLAPWTVHRVRASLGQLPERIDVLSDALLQTTGRLDDLLPMVATVGNLDGAVSGLAGDLAAFRESLEQLLPELSHLVGGMDDRFEHVESTVNELGDAVLNVIGSIPGVRRALQARPQRATL